MAKNRSKASLDGKTSPSPNKSILTMPDKDLHEDEDGQLVYEGDIQQLEKHFPVEGHFKIQQKIPAD